MTARVSGAVPRPSRLPSEAWIAYRGAAGTYPRVAFDDVVSRRPEALAKLRGKVVLLGIDGEGAQRTSAPGAGTLDAVEIQANAVSTALDGFPLRSVGRPLDVGLIILLGLLPVALGLRLRPLLLGPAALLAGGLYGATALLAFDHGRVVAVVLPLASLALATIGVAAVLLLRGGPLRRRDRPRRHLRDRVSAIDGSDPA